MTWSVVSTVDEPKPVVLAFVAHYLELGAEEVFVFLDNPSPQSRAIRRALKDTPRCHVQLCNKAYWLEVEGRRPYHVPRRQRINARVAYAKTRSDWLLHVDCDEFLLNDPGLFKMLETVSDATDYVGVNVAERVAEVGAPAQQVYSDLFRIPLRDSSEAALQDIYGEFFPMLRNNVTGYATVKSLYRTGRAITPGIHSPRDAGQIDKIGATYKEPCLLHFDGFTEESFVAKLTRRISTGHGSAVTKAPARSAQLKFLEDAGDDPETLRRFYRGLKTITPQQKEKLAKIQGVQRFDIDIPATARRHFPDQTLDFSVAAFDREKLQDAQENLAEARK